MKISSINSYSNNNIQSFKGSAVPYPEYQKQNIQGVQHSAVPYPEYIGLAKENKGIIEELSGKISAFFHPEVQKEAANIKANIDSLYDGGNTVEITRNSAAEAHKKLLSVFA